MRPEPLKNKTHYCHEHQVYEDKEDVHPAVRTAVFLKQDVALAVEWLLEKIKHEKEKLERKKREGKLLNLNLHTFYDEGFEDGIDLAEKLIKEAFEDVIE